jgi:hypothetical protein
VADRDSPRRHVWPAQIISATAEVCGTAEIMRRAAVSKPCVWRWQERFMREGVAGLLRDKTRNRGPPPSPFVWTADPDRIIEKVNRGYQAIVLRDKQDEKPYCPHGRCSRDLKRCLTKHAPVASSLLWPSPRSSFVLFNVNYMLLRTLWSCGRRAGVVQAKRQIHRVLLARYAAIYALFSAARETSVDRHRPQYHSPGGFSPPLNCS